MSAQYGIPTLAPPAPTLPSTSLLTSLGLVNDGDAP